MRFVSAAAAYRARVQTLGGGPTSASRPRHAGGVVHLNSDSDDRRTRHSSRASRSSARSPRRGACSPRYRAPPGCAAPRAPVRDVVPAPRLTFCLPPPAARRALRPLADFTFDCASVVRRCSSRMSVLARSSCSRITSSSEVRSLSLRSAASARRLASSTALKSSVGAAAALELHLLELLLHHVQVAVALPHCVLEVLAEERRWETRGRSVSRRRDARR